MWKTILCINDIITNVFWGIVTAVAKTVPAVVMFDRKND